MSCTDDFINAYIEAALWSSVDYESGEPFDNLDLELDAASRKKMADDCHKFIAYMYDHDLTDSCLTRYSVWEKAGHDFWLTRNGHGAGFWETSDWEESAGELLTAFSHVFPACHLFVDDNKVICCE